MIGVDKKIMIDRLPKLEERNIPSDYLRYEPLIQALKDAETEEGELAAKIAYGVKLRSECDKLDNKTKAVLQFCIYDRANRDPTGIYIEMKRDPLDVFEMLAEFEAALQDPEEVVLLTASRTLKTPPAFLSGKVEYRQGRHNFWEVWVGGERMIDLAVICAPYKDPDSLHRAVQRQSQLEEALIIIGMPAIEAYRAIEHSRDSGTYGVDIIEAIDVIKALRTKTKR